MSHARQSLHYQWNKEVYLVITKNNEQHNTKNVQNTHTQKKDKEQTHKITPLFMICLTLEKH